MPSDSTAIPARAPDPAPPVSSADEVRAFATSVIARETLRDVAAVLGDRGIPVMPLKGVLLQLTVYRHPAERRLSDVDVLVPDQRFPEAIAVLIERGYRPERAGPSWIEAALRSPRGLPLDLHRSLFCTRRYQMPTDEQFLRARRDEATLGVPVWIQHPLDTLAHLIGKFVSDHVWSEAPARLAELEKLVDHHGLEPARAARHLARCGLARAARHVLSRGCRERRHGFHAAALAALPEQALDGAIVAVAARLARIFSRGRLAPLSSHLLNTTLSRSAQSLALAGAYAGRHALLARTRGTGGSYWAPFFAGSSSAARRNASSARSL
jgi:hypothetical protein